MHVHVDIHYEFYWNLELSFVIKNIDTFYPKLKASYAKSTFAAIKYVLLRTGVSRSTEKLNLFSPGAATYLYSEFYFFSVFHFLYFLKVSEYLYLFEFIYIQFIYCI